MSSDQKEQKAENYKAYSYQQELQIKRISTLESELAALQAEVNRLQLREDTLTNQFNERTTEWAFQNIEIVRLEKENAALRAELPGPFDIRRFRGW